MIVNNDNSDICNRYYRDIYMNKTIQESSTIGLYKKYIMIFKLSKLLNCLLQ